MQLILPEFLLYPEANLDKHKNKNTNKHHYYRKLRGKRATVSYNPYGPKLILPDQPLRIRVSRFFPFFFNPLVYTISWAEIVM